MSDLHVRIAVTADAFGRQGVGTSILHRLEQTARERGVARLNVAASINAEAFYRKHGYAVVERATHRFRSGHEMACVRMTKRLQ